MKRVPTACRKELVTARWKEVVTGRRKDCLPHQVKIIVPPTYEPHIFTNAELSALFAAADRLAGDDPCCQRAQAALVLRLLYSTGMRCGEACGLSKGDVDLDSGVLTVRHAKNDKDRLVPMHPSVTERMRKLHDMITLAHPWYASHDHFWSLSEGRPLTVRYVYGLFRDALWGGGHIARRPRQGPTRP